MNVKQNTKSALFTQTLAAVSKLKMRLQNTVRPWFLYPKTEVPWTFSLLYCSFIKTVQNQLKKLSVIRLPKFPVVNMAEKCHQHASFTIYKIGFLRINVLEA